MSIHDFHIIKINPSDISEKIIKYFILHPKLSDHFRLSQPTLQSTERDGSEVFSVSYSSKYIVFVPFTFKTLPIQTSSPTTLI